jgi:hypothetical protein
MVRHGERVVATSWRPRKHRGSTFGAASLIMWGVWWRREFAEVLEVVRGDAARVVAVTSADKAKAVLEERPGFWEVKKVL